MAGIKNYMMEMTAQEVCEKMKTCDIVLVPVGSHEMHGYHLPLGCDSIQAWTIAKRTAEKADVFFTNVIWTGYSPHHMHNPGEMTGTITLRAETLRRILYDVAKSLIYHGINKIIYVSYHGSNIKCIDEILRRIRYETGAFVAVYQHSLEGNYKLFKDVIDTLPKDVPPAWHSGQCETSLIMDCTPELVRMDLAVRDTAHAPQYLGPAFYKDDGYPHVTFQGAENIVIPMDHNEYCNSATIGDPFRASPELGATLMQRMVDHCAAFVEEVRKIKTNVTVRDDPFRAY